MLRRLLPLVDAGTFSGAVCRRFFGNLSRDFRKKPGAPRRGHVHHDGSILIEGHVVFCEKLSFAVVRLRKKIEFDLEISTV